MAASDHGRYYWCVETDVDVIWLFADDAEVTYNGDLLFLKKYEDDWEKSTVNFAFPNGKWIRFFAASVIDGGAVALEHREQKKEEEQNEQRTYSI